jgi:hypothetical protein
MIGIAFLLFRQDNSLTAEGIQGPRCDHAAIIAISLTVAYVAMMEITKFLLFNKNVIPVTVGQ